MADRDEKGRFIKGNKICTMAKGVQKITSAKFNNLTKQLLDGLDINLALEYIKSFEPKDYVFCMLRLIELDNNFKLKTAKLHLDREKMELGLAELKQEGQTINITFEDHESDLKGTEELNNDDV